MKTFPRLFPILGLFSMVAFADAAEPVATPTPPAASNKHQKAPEARSHDQSVKATGKAKFAAAAGEASAVDYIPVDITPPHLDKGYGGTLPGTLSVSNGGAANYEIALVVPPGSNGMQPGLSLHYSGASPNGVLGLGWSLSGISSIHRCGKTIAQDGKNDRIRFATSDRLCLDGQRLVRINGADPGADELAKDAAYWAAGGEYRTEIESFSRVTAVSSPVHGGLSFKVESKNGRIATYGRSNDSYVKALVGWINGGITAEQPRTKDGAQFWAIDRIEDRAGNYIRFTYKQDSENGALRPSAADPGQFEHRPSGENLITAIRYGGAGLASHAAVVFEYEARPDAWTRYIDESHNDLRKRISFIKTYVGEDLDGENIAASANLVRNYALKYERSASSGRSLLTSATVCANRPGGGGIDCLPSTNFSYGKPDAAKPAQFRRIATNNGFWPGAPVLTTYNLAPVEGMVHGGRNHADYFAFADFNNDGFADVLEKRVASPKPTDWNTYEGRVREASNSIAPGTKRRDYRYFHNNGTGFTEHRYKLDIDQDFVVLDVGDFDGDGAPDILVEADRSSKMCLSPLADPRVPGSAGSTIIFRCQSLEMPYMWANNDRTPSYVVDVDGDGRYGVYSTVTSSDTAILCRLHLGCVSESNPPDVLKLKLPGFRRVDDNSPEYAAREYTSFNQMVDFSGLGKPYDVRWTEPLWVAHKEPDVEQETYEMRNLEPIVRLENVNYPEAARVSGKMANYAYPYDVGPPPATPPTQVMAPYAFERPYAGSSLSADFNGSGYSGLVFGYMKFG